jgi:hypothetical protein
VEAATRIVARGGGGGRGGDRGYRGYHGAWWEEEVAWRKEAAKSAIVARDGGRMRGGGDRAHQGSTPRLYCILGIMVYIQMGDSDEIRGSPASSGFHDIMHQYAVCSTYIIQYYERQATYLFF